MQYLKPFLALACSIGLAAPAMAEAPPPEALPLSELLARLEATGNVRYFDEVDWDDKGHWDIEYVAVGGEEVEIEVDPVTGELRN